MQNCEISGAVEAEADKQWTRHGARATILLDGGKVIAIESYAKTSQRLVA